MQNQVKMGYVGSRDPTWGHVTHIWNFGTPLISRGGNCWS